MREKEYYWNGRSKGGCVGLKDEGIEGQRQQTHEIPRNQIRSK